MGGSSGGGGAWAAASGPIRSCGVAVFHRGIRLCDPPAGTAVVEKPWQPSAGNTETVSRVVISLRNIVLDPPPDKPVTIGSWQRSTETEEAAKASAEAGESAEAVKSTKSSEGVETESAKSDKAKSTSIESEWIERPND